MKVMLDACAIDWLLDNPSSAAFLTCIQAGKLDAFVSADVLFEVNCTPLKKGDRRQRLLGIAFSDNCFFSRFNHYGEQSTRVIT